MPFDEEERTPRKQASSSLASRSSGARSLSAFLDLLLLLLLFGCFLGRPMAAGTPCEAERDESAEEEKAHSAEDDAGVRDDEERNAAKPGR